MPLKRCLSSVTMACKLHYNGLIIYSLAPLMRRACFIIALLVTTGDPSASPECDKYPFFIPNVASSIVLNIADTLPK